MPEGAEVVVVVVPEGAGVVVSSQVSDEQGVSFLKIPPRVSHCILVKSPKHSLKTQQAPVSSGARVVVVVVVVVVPQPPKRIEAQSPSA